MLDEAHTIKSPKSQISLATAALTADRRWCLTGTPIQVNIYWEFLFCSIYVHVIFLICASGVLLCTIVLYLLGFCNSFRFMLFLNSLLDSISFSGL